MSTHSSQAVRPPRIPAYCLHKASGRAYVKIDGRMTYLGSYGSTASRETYAEIVAVILSGKPGAAAVNGEDTNFPSLTVRDVCQRFAAHAKGYYRKAGKPTNEASVVAAACTRVAELMGDLPATAFGPRALKSVRSDFVEAGLARSTVNSMIGQLATFAQRILGHKALITTRVNDSGNIEFGAEYLSSENFPTSEAGGQELSTSTVCCIRLSNCR